MKKLKMMLKKMSIWQVALCASAVIAIILDFNFDTHRLPTIELGQISEKLFGTDILNFSIPLFPRVADVVAAFLFAIIIGALVKKIKKGLTSPDNKGGDEAIGIIAGLAISLIGGLIFGALNALLMPTITSFFFLASFGIAISFILSAFSEEKCGLWFALAFGQGIGLTHGLIFLSSQGLAIGFVLGLGFSVISMTGILVDMLIRVFLPRQTN